MTPVKGKGVYYSIGIFNDRTRRNTINEPLDIPDKHN